MGAQQAKRGFGTLHCPLCGQDAVISVDLDDVRTFRCQECGDEFTEDHVRGMVAAWHRVLAWLDTAPARE